MFDMIPLLLQSNDEPYCKRFPSPVKLLTYLRLLRLGSRPGHSVLGQHGFFTVSRIIDLFRPVVFGTKVEEVGMVYFSRCGAMYERHSSK
jgi:hypothetical protein